MTLETTLAALASCKIEPKGSLSHEPITTDPSAWKSALQAAPSSAASVPSEYKLTKTLVFKPKTAKSAAPTPLILIASEETDTKATNAISKQTGLKELRIASDDLIKEFFGVDKASLSALSLNAELLPKVVVVVDDALASSDNVFAVRAASNEATVFMTGKDIYGYLSSLQTDASNDQAKVLHTFDFANAAETAASSTPIAKAAAPTKKTDARIEDAHQLAIGVKKEVDFSTWYTNVLLKSDMIDYYSVSGCYILKPWSYTIWQEIQRRFGIAYSKQALDLL